ncbi:MAG TPA: pyridoxal phosphate-dependent aminotransferase [Candidatus Thermoplasmatota archaeon]|nr:pyridoxal phosphate-dependent aminotransferase [Candidatus Thermoplasmatota archaeon]
MPRLSARSGLQESATTAIGERVREMQRQGIDVVALTLGEPDFDTPDHVKEAAMAAIRAGKTKYVSAPGIPELRAAISRREQAVNHIPCEARHVLVTPSKLACFLGLQSCVEPGDEVLLPDPGWVSYDPMVRWAGGTPVAVPLERGTDFRMRPEAVAERITPKTRCIVLNSPSNPTGGVNTPSDVRGIVELAVDHDLWILSDEIYQGIRYEGEHVSPASLPGGWERTWTVGGLSKSFAMTGWRIGWLVAPDNAVDAAIRLQSHTITHPTSFVQDAAVAAVTGSQESVRQMRDEFRARRDLFVPALRELPGVSCPLPGGAFYAFPSFDPGIWGEDDVALCQRILQEARVAGTPGSAFGSQGRGHIRFSYAASRERLTEAIRRLQGLAQALPAQRA